jgi:IS605 OrfB family transposase
MKKTLRQNLRGLSSSDYGILRKLCRLSKNMFNVHLYTVRQYFFDNGEYLSYNQTYERVKTNENYELLPSQVAQQTMKNVDKAFQSFFKLNEKKREGKYNGDVHPPGYLDKDGFYMIDFPNQSFQIKDDHLRIGVPKSMREKFGIDQTELQIPFTYAEVRGKAIKRLQILPKGDDCDYFEYRLIYEEDVKETNVDPDNFLAMDLGVENFATCVDHTGRSFILDGRKINHINWWFNKKKAKLQAVKDKQGIDGSTSRLDRLHRSRRNKLHDRMNKMVHALREYCLEHKIGTILVGDGTECKDSINLGDRVNQTFVQIPFALFKRKLKGMCEEYGIGYELVNESYTSKCSFFDGEFPEKKSEYAGRRIERGLFETADGTTVNADVNGALNIAEKHYEGQRDDGVLSSDRVVSDVDSPPRIREPFTAVRMGDVG